MIEASGSAEILKTMPLRDVVRPFGQLRDRLRALHGTWYPGGISLTDENCLELLDSHGKKTFNDLFLDAVTDIGPLLVCGASYQPVQREECAVYFGTILDILQFVDIERFGILESEYYRNIGTILTGLTVRGVPFGDVRGLDYHRLIGFYTGMADAIVQYQTDPVLRLPDPVINFYSYYVDGNGVYKDIINSGFAAGVQMGLYTYDPFYRTMNVDYRRSRQCRNN